MAPDLPESYYLDNVKTLFDHVDSVYADILHKDYLNFINRFRLLSEDAQRLVIRLLNRSHSIFRLGKIKYTEIGSISLAIEELSKCGFLDVNPGLDKEEILPLFNKAELIELADDTVPLKKLNRADLNQYLLNEESDAFHHRLTNSETFIQITNKDIYLLLQMLFFGNLNQSMTDFVLRDLGLYQFESYRIDAESRPFNNSLEIEQFWLLHELDSLIDLDNPEILMECFANLPDNTQPDSPVYRKVERIKYEIARQIERLGALDQALELYRQCRLPPSRERITRIYHQQENIVASIDMCKQILDSPIDEAEVQFASEFSTRLAKRHGLKPFAEPRQYQPEILELELNHHSSVEQAVVEHYQSTHPDQQCYYLENSLFNGVLGLLIWEAVFTPLAGAFYNPFQYRPSDFYAHDFVRRREDMFKKLWNSIQSNDDIWNIVSARWVEKQGLMNPLVDWHSLNLDIIELALQRINHQHWLRIFERVLNDLRNHRAGFPDLILFPADTGYKLVEVKGPGDKLQKNQQRWMAYFAEHDIPHEVARVSWLRQTVAET